MRLRHASLILFLALLGSAGCDSDTASNTPATTGAAPEPLAQATAGIMADTLYFGGPIVTVDDALQKPEAVAVKNGRILVVGSLAEVEKHQGPDTQRLNLAGRTLVPGFVDGHAHLTGFGMQAVGANLLASPDGQVATIDELVRTLSAWAEGDDDERLGWIYGMGYDDAILAEQRHPTRDDLDRVSTEQPVIAIHISGHFAAVNSKGLEVIGYSTHTPDPEGGVIRRRPGSMEPNGVLEELAAIPVFMVQLAPKTPEDGVYFMQRGLEMAKSYGYTTAQEGRAFANTHDGLVNYANSNGFEIDVVSYIDYSDTRPLESVWYGDEYRNGYRVGGLKVTLDGSPQGRTAWRTLPYLLPPAGQGADYSGYPAISDDKVVTKILTQAYREGWQVLAHANGDAAIDQLIRTVRIVHEKYGAGDRRTTLVHGQYVRMDQLDAMAELQIAASLFPMHTFYWGDWHEQIIGEELGQQISPTRSALDRALPVTSHSDAPVALPNLMQVVWATVNRTSRSGKVIGPGERLTPEEALKSITLWGAWQHFEEDQKGSITPGKLADLVVLSDNPLTIAPERINEIVVMKTIKEGVTVWQQGED
jgi:predicted amidohydrolase YtcJ